MKKQKISLLLILFLLAESAGFAQNNPAQIGDVLTLKQAVDIAISNNLLVEQSDIARLTAQITRDQGFGYLLPSISANGSQSISAGRALNTYTYQYLNTQINSGTYSISGNLVLFSGLITQNNIRQTALAFQASKLDLEQQKQNITLSVMLQYMQVESAEDVLDISRAQADVDKKQLDRLDLQNQSGALLDLSSLSDLRGQYATDLANIATNVNNLESAKISLFQFLNVPYKRDAQYEKIDLNLEMGEYRGNPDSIYNIALKTLPTIKSADLKIKAYQKALAVARGYYYPSLSFNASIYTTYSNQATTSIPGSISNVTTSDFITINGTNYSVISPQQNFATKNLSFDDQFNNNKYTNYGLSLYIPILNQLQYRNRVRQAKVNLQNQRYNAINTKLTVQQNVEQAYQNMVMASSQLTSDQEAVAGFQESFRIKEIKFNEGVITSDVYLLAKNNIDRANINLTIAKYNYIFRAKILDYYEGKLSY